MSDSITVETVRPDELASAFRVIFRHVRSEERESRVGNALELVRLGLLDAAGIKVARDQRGGVAGAVISATVAGAGGIVWPAQAFDPEVEERLMRAALAWLRERGAKLAQALLPDHERALGVGLERAGFTHITDLWYLRHDLGAPPRAATRSLCYQTYAECDAETFHRTLVRTYEETLDCPEVNGVRNIDEVIAGHRSQGAHDPKLWWLALEDDTPVGVVLLTPMPEWGDWDLIYLGVVKERRGQGFGRELTARAIAAACAARARQLTLSVDVRNQAAWNLYRQAGFEPYDQRAVYLSILAGTS